jgi:hypothetical protein
VLIRDGGESSVGKHGARDFDNDGMASVGARGVVPMRATWMSLYVKVYEEVVGR